MRTNEQILERYLSDDSEDILNAQRTALLCMLPYEIAKPHLDKIYVENHDNGSLPEEEMWKEDWKIKDQILDFLPHGYKALRTNNNFELLLGIFYLKAWVWAEDSDFYEIIEPLFGNRESAEELLKAISEHYGYEESIEVISFTELPSEDINSDLSS